MDTIIGYKKSRNICLYFFEALGAIFIVFMHSNFPGDFGLFMYSLGKFGVPIFFAISGFFLYKNESSKEEIRSKLKKRIIRVSFLLLLSFIIYFTLDAVTSCTGDNSINFGEYLARVFHWKKFIFFFALNYPFTNGIHNWFMIALIFSYLIIYLFPNLFFKNDKFLYAICSLIVILLIFRYVSLATHMQIFGVELANEWMCRSWFDIGLLFICLGIVLKKKEDVLKKISMRTTVIMLFLSLAIMVTEQMLLKKLLGQYHSYYFGSIGCVIFMITLSIKKPSLFSNIKLLNLKGNWTAYVYIFHPAIITSLSLLFSSVGVQGIVLDWFMPLMVLALSLILAILFNLLVETIKDKRASKKTI